MTTKLQKKIDLVENYRNQIQYHLDEDTKSMSATDRVRNALYFSHKESLIKGLDIALKILKLEE